MGLFKIYLFIALILLNIIQTKYLRACKRFFAVLRGMAEAVHTLPAWQANPWLDW
jgi:hypothetical protein